MIVPPVTAYEITRAEFAVILAEADLKLQTLIAESIREAARDMRRLLNDL